MSSQSLVLNPLQPPQDWEPQETSSVASPPSPLRILKCFSPLPYSPSWHANQSFERYFLLYSCDENIIPLCFSKSVLSTINSKEDLLECTFVVSEIDCLRGNDADNSGSRYVFRFLLFLCFLYLFVDFSLFKIPQQLISRFHPLMKIITIPCARPTPHSGHEGGDLTHHFTRNGLR